MGRLGNRTQEGFAVKVCADSGTNDPRRASLIIRVHGFLISSRSPSMLRIVGASLAVVAAALFLTLGSAEAQNAKKNQMVKGTIKSVEADKDVLIVAQQVKNEKVDRELSITPDVEFTITAKGKTETANGRNGLR